MAIQTGTAEDFATFTCHACASVGHLVPVSAFDAGGFLDYAAGGTDSPAADAATFTGVATAKRALARARLGDRLTLNLTTTAVPDTAPIVVILNSSNIQVFAGTMPALDNTLLRFQLPLLVDTRFAIGSFMLYYHYVVAGVSSSQQDTFTVIAGGDSGGSVVSMHALDRAESHCVVAQLQGGQLVLGRNPAISL